MSWSVNASGKGDSLKEALKQQFDGAENGTPFIPEEQAVVKQTRAIVESVTELMPNGADVSAYGSVSYNSADGKTQIIGHNGFSIQINPRAAESA